ncbi:DUF4405 domain-containing protein [Azotosporobacter soli]|uniref:DUF4405 domain-containing protein n=1 Tax=Azotosporobacter soli TaxID=3055040 RepID=UPI0031FEB0B2
MRKITSIILALAFILVSITGIQLTGGKPPASAATVQIQSVASAAPNSENAAAPVRQKSFYPKVAHEWGGYLFILAGAVHLGLNWRPMRSYLQPKKQAS